jgi:hypothetical protein
VFSLDNGKRKLLGVEWTGISVGSRADVDLLAGRKIPPLRLIRALIFSQ